MKLPHLVAVGLFASLGLAQAQPSSETPGLSRDAARPTTLPRPGTETPAGVIQGTIPSTTGQGTGAAQGTVPVAPPPGVPPQGSVPNQGPPAQTGLAPGNRARDVPGMGAPSVGAAPGMTPPHRAGSPDEVQMLRLQPFSGMVPGMEARSAHDMGAGRPPTPMPPGSVAGQAPGMGGLRAPPR